MGIVADVADAQRIFACKHQSKTAQAFLLGFWDARFYFHVVDDLVALDEEGIELPDLGAAERQAALGAQELIAEEVRVRGRVPLHHRIEVTDEQGEVIVTLPFKQVVTIEDQ